VSPHLFYVSLAVKEFSNENDITVLSQTHVKVLYDKTNTDDDRDEILYNAKLHPAQYSDTFSSEQLKQLHASIIYVCQTAVSLLGDSIKFPDDWLFNHRWGKGKKDAAKTLPNGASITFLTVGGRTSCIVPSVQIMTGAITSNVKTNAVGAKVELNTSKKRKISKKETQEDESNAREIKKPKAIATGRKIKCEEEAAVEKSIPKRAKTKDFKIATECGSQTADKKKVAGGDALTQTRRRSGRNSKE
jgi:formamidopyrimidine-DNA glycosylase